MTVQIQLNARSVPFNLFPEKGSWQSLEKHQESFFPLITHVNGKRYELYSDGTLAEAEK